MRLQAFIDGASRGNPGPASVGVLLQDEQGRILKEHCRTIGVETNNFAEYTALEDALRLAEEMGADEIEVRSDSQLLVRQVCGEYRVKNEKLSAKLQAIRQLRRRFKRFELSHVLREKNREADRLANRALDEAAAPPPADPPLSEEESYDPPIFWNC